MPAPDLSSPGLWLVLNGKSAGEDPVREAVAALRGQGHPVAVRVTWEDGDAARYVAEALEAGARTIVAAGGDGTLSEVAEALAAQPGDAASLPALALLPLGTANDFATAAGIPDVPEEALELALQAPPVPVDLLRIDTGERVHWCANLASGGFGTEVTVETDEGLKSLLGGLAYLVTGIAKLGRIEPVEVRVHGDGFDWEGGLIALGLGNGRQAGGGRELCPEALVNDGLLELTVIPELSGELAATLGTLVRNGQRAALERSAVRARLPWVELQGLAGPFTLNLDGEPLQARRFRVDCVPGRLRMHLPPQSPLLAQPS
ncbi:diacylglycerol kinase catalytic region [Pseudoxanthomonas suwonensis 11-1]|uniref:Probable lipid kinase YegS-like n=1 Tax=Pseudoxanthomonas suwonensis (strain 11-1) TaxID=743721 RepID=E6WWC6_PSEUU|nr:lipid kinase YegS [Pseudoxanthomonas suwonensis]ADV28334.1 diacylglycerol kinase catalytic region [Pseudoxanthomonas suwonensis 11-1]